MTSTRTTQFRHRPAPVLVAMATGSPRDLVAGTLAAGRLANPVVAVPDVPAATAYVTGHAPYDDRLTHPLPAVVVAHLHLEGGDGPGGLDLLRAMRTPALRRIPVVVVGDEATDAEIDEAHRLGASAYLAQPVVGRALLDVMRGLDLPWWLSAPRELV
jgi:CheY-like chemotaxis protein